MHRRNKSLGVIGLGLAVIVIAACGSNGNGQSQGSSGSKAPITIAYFADTSGVNESVDATGVAGAKVGIADVNKAGGVLGGRKLVLKIVPDPSDPSQMPSLVRNLASSGIKIMSGGDQTAYCVAAAPIAEQLQILDVSESCAGAPLTGPQRLSKNFFTVGVSSYMVGSGLASAALSKAPQVTKFYVVGYAVPPLEEVAQTFEAREKAQHSISVGASYFVPYTQTDFSQIVTSLASKVGSNAAHQGLVLTTFGDGTLSFLKQAQSAGLLKKFGFVGTSYAYYAAAASFKGSAPKLWDAYQYDDWSLYHNNAANTAFVAAFRKVAPTLGYPDDNAYGGYVWAMAMAKAIDAAGGLNYQKLINAVDNLNFKSITGQITVDQASHQFLLPIVVAQLGGSTSSPDFVSVSDATIVPGAEAFNGSFACGKAFCA
jgi:branched-chain amino acid transport system substrate-binding protein